MKVTGRITLDKHMTLEQVESLEEAVRGIAYPRLDMANLFMYFDLETDDYGAGDDSHDLGIVTARALADEARDLGVDFEVATRLVKKAVAVASVWDEVENLALEHAVAGGSVTVVE